MSKADSETGKSNPFDANELLERLRTLRSRFDEFRGRL
jgi:hypothetical protein